VYGSNPFEAGAQAAQAVLSGCWCFLFLIFAAFVAGLVVIILRAQEIPEEEILERWSTLLPNEAEKREWYYQLVEHWLTGTNLRYARTNLSRFPSEMPKTNDTTYTVCDLDKTYCCYFGTIVIGAHLHVNWALREKDRLAWVLRLWLIGPPLYRLLLNKTFTGRNRARAFAAVTLQAAVEAADRMAHEAGIEKSRVNRKSSGKLGPL